MVVSWALGFPFRVSASPYSAVTLAKVYLYNWRMLLYKQSKPGKFIAKLMEISYLLQERACCDQTHICMEEVVEIENKTSQNQNLHRCVGP